MWFSVECNKFHPILRNLETRYKRAALLKIGVLKKKTKKQLSKRWYKQQHEIGKVVLCIITCS